MTQLDVDNVTLPEPPPCPPWCAGHAAGPHESPRAGWDDAIPAAVTKWCKLELASMPQVPQGSDGPVRVWVSRFADLRWEDEDDNRLEPMEVCVDPAHVRIDDWIEFTPEQAEALAAQLVEAARLARLSPIG